MRRDGSILNAPGWDEATGLWLEMDRDFILPPLAERPTIDDARRALELLKSLIRGWPWTSETDKAVALAAILTAVLRGAFQMAPVFLLVAPKASSGKSFFVDLVAHIVTGRWAPVISLNERREEADKQLGALLLEGPPIISLDNLMQDLGGALLNQMTTQPTVKIRILGKSKAPECEWRGCYSPPATIERRRGR